MSKGRFGTSTVKWVLISLVIYVILAFFLGASVEIVILMSEPFVDIYEHPALFALFEIIFLLCAVLIASFIDGIANRTSKLEFVKKIATFPSRHNYNWQGGYSAIVSVILNAIALFRSISFLQIGKFIYRKMNSTSKDVAANRVNVPPIFQELYFLSWIVFIFVQLKLRLINPLVIGLDIYFIIESLTWIFYYSVFRRFFEENYSIYHVLEHLPIVLMMIPAQAAAYAQIITCNNPDYSWKDVLVVLLGQAESNQILFSLIGFFYSAIVISMILSMFPGENIKHGNPQTVIVGAGDVVKNRLLPSILGRNLKLANNRHERIEIYDLREGIDFKSWETISSMKEVSGLLGKGTTKSIFDLINKKKTGEETVAWICTPSDTHWYYLELLKSKCDYIAVEKPLTSRKDELELFKDYAQSDYRDHTFFLSYYLLEKGLPLSFLCRPKRLYLKYLAGYDENGEPIEKEEDSVPVIKAFYQMYLESGSVRSFSMSIIEGSDERKLPEGGQLIETFVHNCIMASLFTGLPSEWTDERFDSADDNTIDFHARGRLNSTIDLLLKKNAPADQEKQIAHISLDKNGVETTIDIDFKTKIAKITCADKTISIGVKKEFRGKYDVQCAMVYDCFDNSIKTSDVDGLFNQIEVLEWLFEKKDEMKR